MPRTPETRPLYDEPSWYNRIFRERKHDVEHYLTLAETAPPGHILELGVGAGRVAIPLARSGRHIDGVDLSKPMLSSCEKRLELEAETVRGRLRLHCMDGALFHGEQPYALALIPFNGIAHQHSPGSLKAYLQNAHEQLTPDGCLALDFLKVDPERLRGGVAEIPWLEDPLLGVPARATETVRYERDTKTFHIETQIRPMKGDAQPRTLTLRLRQWSHHEVAEILNALDGSPSVQRVDLGDSHAYIARRNGKPSAARK